MRILPTWTLEELFDIAPYLPPYVSPDVIKERYDRFGGIPRYIAAPFDEYQELCIAQDRAIVQTTLDALGQIAIDFQNLDLHSHKLMAINSEYPFTLMTVAISFLSPYVFAKYLEKEETLNFDAFVRVFNSLRKYSVAPPFAGALFELYSISRLSMGGEFQFQGLPAREISRSHLTIPPMRRSQFPGHQLPTSLEPNVLYYSESSTFPAIDAFALVDETILLFQITTAETHSSSEKLPQLVHRLKVAFGSLEAGVSFIFVLPGDRFVKYEKLTPPPCDGVTYGLLLMPIEPFASAKRGSSMERV